MIEGMGDVGRIQGVKDSRIQVKILSLLSLGGLGEDLKVGEQEDLIA
jgi:hypothetical protein